MLKVISKIKYALFALVLIIGVSCSPEDGVDGVDGIDGAQGPAGPQGPAGQDGNANVVSVLVENFTLVLGENEIAITELTSDISNNGLVQGYVAGEDGVWFSLPFSILEEVTTADGTTFTSTIILEVIAIEPGKVVVFSLIEGTVNLRFALVEGTPSS